MKMAIRIALPMLVAIAAALPARAAETGGWRAWDEGLRQAGASRRPVLVDVYTDWCGWCKRMDRDVYSRPEVKSYLGRKFVIVRLNAEAADAAQYEGKAYTERSLAARFRVTGYPTTIFLTSAGEHLANVPGYVPADRFLLLLHYIGDGWLDKGVTFDDYVKKTTDGAEPDER